MARIGGGADIDVKTLNINPDHDQDVDANVDSVTLGLAAGTGGAVTHNINTKSVIDIQPGATTIDAENATLLAKNFAEKTRFTRSLKAATVSGVSITGLGSFTKLGTAANPLSPRFRSAAASNLQSKVLRDRCSIFPR